jgi:hypothetical protein
MRMDGASLLDFGLVGIFPFDVAADTDLHRGDRGFSPGFFVWIAVFMFLGPEPSVPATNQHQNSKNEGSFTVFARHGNFLFGSRNSAAAL